MQGLVTARYRDLAEHLAEQHLLPVERVAGAGGGGAVEPPALGVEQKTSAICVREQQIARGPALERERAVVAEPASPERRLAGAAPQLFELLAGAQPHAQLRKTGRPPFGHACRREGAAQLQPVRDVASQHPPYNCPGQVILPRARSRPSRRACKPSCARVKRASLPRCGALCG